MSAPFSRAPAKGNIKLTRIESILLLICALLIALIFLSETVWGEKDVVLAPLVCSRGPNGQTFRARVLFPETPETGSEIEVRIDSFPSQKVSHFGLNYLFDMRTDYLVPDGTRYVAGSARVVPHTGSPNVQEGANAWYDSKGIHLFLPAHVHSGSSYTPPSIAFGLRVTAAAGTALLLHFSHYHVAASVAVLGTVHTHCDPQPSPYVIARGKVAAAH